MWNAWGIAWGDSWGSSWGPLYDVEEPQGWDTAQGVAGKNKPAERNYYVEWANQEFERKQRLLADDKLACEFIMALVHMEMLDG